MPYKYTIQDMIDMSGHPGVSVASITRQLHDDGYGNINGTHWDIADDICNGIVDNTWEVLSAKQKIDRLCDLFELWPSYSILSRLFSFYIAAETLEQSSKSHLWLKMVSFLDRKRPHHCEAMEYVIWVDFFENQSTCAEAWSGLMTAAKDKTARDRLVVNAGPVPYHLKKQIYHMLAKKTDDHEILTQSLARSLQDVYGDLDIKDAKVLMRKISLPRKNKYLKYLRENL